MLMTEHKASLSRHMFGIFKDHASRLNLAFEPTRVPTDFEKALNGVIKTEVSSFADTCFREQASSFSVSKCATPWMLLPLYSSDSPKDSDSWT